MGIIGVVLLALSLAMDCFSVTIACGVSMKRFDRFTFLKVGVVFGLFHVAMPVIGWFVASLFSDLIRAYDHWIAFALLVFLGVRMIMDCFKEPEKCNFNIGKLSVMLTVALATSIDALAIGVTFAFVDMGFPELMESALIIGAINMLVSVVGGYAGSIMGKHLNLRLEWVGGVVLIGLGVKMLCEHLGLL